MIEDNTALWKLKKVTNFTDTEREIATQAQAEEGVDNTTTMTPLRVKNAIDKQRPLKTFTSLEQIGLDANASEVDIASAMPINSTLMFNAYSKDAFPNLTIPFIGRLKITRWGGETVKFELCRAQTEGNYVGVVLAISAGFRGWKQLATKGALSMPSANSVSVATPAFTPNYDDYEYFSGIYIAPCDGWFWVGATVSNANAHYLQIYSNSNLFQVFNWSEWTYQRGYIPCAKGDSIGVHTRNITEMTLKFFYAQSEV